MSDETSNLTVEEIEPGIFMLTETSPVRGGGTTTHSYPLDLASGYARIAAWEARRKETMAQIAAGDEAHARLKEAVQQMEKSVTR